MTEKKRKERDEGNRQRLKPKKKPNTQWKKRGPRLPSSLQKQLHRLNPTTSFDSVDSDDDNDVYEYEEERAEEESKKNKRYDPASVDDDLAQDIEDENVQSDDESEDDDYTGTKRNENAPSDDSGEEDDDRHARMLQAITGMPSEAFEENKKKKKVMKDTVIPELYPESEYNPSRDVVDGDGRISIEDLLNPLREKSGYGKLRKRYQQIEKNAKIIHVPLSKAVQAKVERKAAYEISKKDVTKWQHIIQRNREAPTIFFDENVNLGFSTVGAIASEFEPRTEFEKKIAALVYDEEVMEAHKKDGSKLLEMNKVSIEDEKDRQNRIAKMRSLLFRHEMKAKHIKKIKSRTFHRLLKKDRLKAEASQMQMDPEAAKEYAMKQERQRAEERMTLKHKNHNPWAARIIQRGLHNQDEGTRAAIHEQLQRHAELTRKMKSMKGSSSSSEDSSDEDEDDNSAGSDQDRDYKILGKAKEKTVKVLEEEDEVPKSGLLSLPFMRRGLEKRKEAAVEEANLAFHEYEDSLKKLENTGGSEDLKAASTSGRRVFGMAKAQMSDTSNKVKSDNCYDGSDSEDDLGISKSGNIENEGSDLLHTDVNKDLVVIQDDTDTHRESVFKNIDEIIKNPGPKTTYDVSIFVSDTWKKAKNKNEDMTIKKSPKLTELDMQAIKVTEKEFGEDSDTDCEGQMVDGILSSVSKVPYELPSQEELIRQAFAGDDVDDDFEKDKQEILNEENPEPEKPLLLPGWGQWTHVQQKKGLPSWMLKKHEDAQKKRAEALKKRKDAQLKNVIISEKIDKKAEKLHTKSLPYPFTSQEVFEQSMRVPIGPEFNPATAIGPLNRPEVVKRPGVIIKPIEFEEVNPHEKTEQRSGGDKRKFKKNKVNADNPMKKGKVGRKS
ncbi:hypothetical protein AAZX31_19G198400 [Glycine max]|uniref:Uncharacterized protein n=2 Tax=Glycine subgen. Soja TaxID=1462606 RepID=K7MZI3_SOYBN|nr:U3 small nucleolar RNA-associated protein 14 isoform X2 [Glycine max]XP_028218331.1 U3 small nucleolar RNA-associated protein 14 isoform X2 [Glycine soja]KAG4913701.1 hypothetical protein JHK86_054134 [Glycine max]KAG5086891.1 hypothetical protein JHK82_054288 [Glycine max]KAH1078911.1 hypothetical protein GYH30_053777 [Glycine max]KAH1195609.1 hypothetical protein GmHk_19G056080 [Glycine max]KRG96451.1 hypothetical protein GLYMA_19G211500v4 [Glycine max]|eukprot:XP_006604722.1 U3 small nucleolar RNA-associated protein 14 isoform X2 [Glycine max]